MKLRKNKLNLLFVFINGFSFRFTVKFLLILLTVFGCAPVEIKVDYNKQIHFDIYRTYKWITNEQLDIIDLNIDKQVLDKLVTNTGNKQLDQKGFSIDNESPDFLVSYYLVIGTKTDVYIAENYYSNIPYKLPSTTSSTRDYQRIRESTYEQGILIIDIVDQVTKERIWRGYAQSRLGIYTDPEKREKRVTSAVNKILSNFPP